MKRRALTVLRLVKPATFELTRLSDKGMLAANTAPKEMPTSRPTLLFSSSFHTRIIPIIEVAVLIIIMITRVLGMYVVNTVVATIKTICAAPRGICSNKDFRVEYPKPLIKIVPN